MLASITTDSQAEALCEVLRKKIDTRRVEGSSAARARSTD
jgi:hypothetical protein